MHMGKLFEKVLRVYVEIDTDTQICGDDICTVNGQFRYSPDGLGVVSLTTKGVTSRNCFIGIQVPFSRKPDGSIPKHYLPKMCAGLMATKEITDRGMYVDAVFRR